MASAEIVQERDFFLSKNKGSRSAEDEPLDPPVLPPAGLAPHVEVLSSSFASDWYTMMADTGSTDVRFMFADGQSVEAHKTVLMAASSNFKNIFQDKMTASHKCYGDILKDISWVCDKGSSCPNLIHVKEQCQSNGKTVIALHESISKGVFMEVLTFLYTGSPDIAEGEDIWEYCANILKGDSLLNPPIRTWLNDNTGLAAKKLYLNKALQVDVKFHVQGSIVYGHRMILKARSEVMAAMLGGAFRESDLDTEIDIHDASLESFLALLEYLYTDHFPEQKGDAVEVMIDRFCLPRLVSLCELYLTRKIEKAFYLGETDGTSDVVNLLLISQDHNAKQLTRWCLHFIATNYSVFESTEEFSLVQGENREYVSEHRWPPLSYLKAKEEFEKKVRSSNLTSKCKVM